MDNNAFAASSLDPYTRLLVGRPTLARIASKPAACARGARTHAQPARTNTRTWPTARPPWGCAAAVPTRAGARGSPARGRACAARVRTFGPARPPAHPPAPAPACPVFAPPPRCAPARDATATRCDCLLVSGRRRRGGAHACLPAMRPCLVCSVSMRAPLRASRPWVGPWAGGGRSNRVSGSARARTRPEACASRLGCHSTPALPPRLPFCAVPHRHL